MISVALPLHGIGEPRPAFATVSAMFDHAVATMPDAVALRHLGVALTYREEGRAVSALARRLAAIAAPGDVVALLLPNSIAFPVAYFAALRALTVPALLNPLYPAAQLEPLLRDVAPRVVVCTPQTHGQIADLAHRHAIAEVICIGHDAGIAGLAAEPETPLGHAQPLAAGPGTPFGHAQPLAAEPETPLGRAQPLAAGPGTPLGHAQPLAADPGTPLGHAQPRPQDSGALLFSGGTTGLPKAVEHTHESLMIAVRCVEYNWPTRASGEVWLPVAPFAHIYGFLQGVLSPVHARAEVVIPERFKPEHIVELLVRHRVTVFGGGPPAIYAGVLAAPNLAGADLSALRVCPAGGAPVPVELHERWRRATGLAIHEGYGMTEMAPISGTTAQTGIRAGSVGKPMPCNEAEIVDIETGTRVLPPGQRGEVRVRGPHMMSGYRGRPAETAGIIRAGYLYTGDIGHLDADGFLFITDRKKDVVLVNGFNVFPREVEEAIHAHPKVAAIGVVGVPDPRSGERVVAYVVAREGAALAQAEIAAFAAERLASYARPAEIRIVTALPMTGAHKLDRAALRRRAASPVSP